MPINATTGGRYSKDMMSTGAELGAYTRHMCTYELDVCLQRNCCSEKMNRFSAGEL